MNPASSRSLGFIGTPCLPSHGLQPSWDQPPISSLPPPVDSPRGTNRLRSCVITLMTRRTYRPSSDLYLTSRTCWLSLQTYFYTPLPAGSCDARTRVAADVLSDWVRPRVTSLGLQPPWTFGPRANRRVLYARRNTTTPFSWIRNQLSTIYDYTATADT